MAQGRTRKINRYITRKYYCHTRKRYINLTDIIEDIYDGLDVEIRYFGVKDGSFKMHDDITMRTLKSALFSLFKRATKDLSKEQIVSAILAYKPK